MAIIIEISGSSKNRWKPIDQTVRSEVYSCGVAARHSFILAVATTTQNHFPVSYVCSTGKRGRWLGIEDPPSLVSEYHGRDQPDQHQGSVYGW